MGLINGFFLAVSADQVELYRRCDYCNAGFCQSQVYETDTCLPFCDPCDGRCEGSYYLAKQADNDYYIKTFNNLNCSSEYQIGVHVYCDTCYYYDNTNFCPAFFIRCASYWWIWTLCILLVAICGCLIVSGVAAFLRKKQLEAVFTGQSQPEFVTYDQALHQSQVSASGYQAS